MRVEEAEALIRPAVAGAGGRWVDLGAGEGLFTRALARLLGPAGTIVAVDRDRRALAVLRRAAESASADITAVEGDLRHLDRVPELDGVLLDGALLANALHFVADPASTLAAVARRLERRGRIVVVEYAGRAASPWVPHPVSPRRLHEVAVAAGLPAPTLAGERPSAYGGTMYCAVIEGATSDAGR